MCFIYNKSHKEEDLRALWSNSSNWHSHVAGYVSLSRSEDIKSCDIYDLAEK